MLCNVLSRSAGLLSALLVLWFAVAPLAAAPPEGFVYVGEACPDIVLEIRYYSTYNFVGERLDGYHAPLAILSEPAAKSLCTAATALREQGYRLKIFDAYRPQSAVDHFVRWGNEATNTRMKSAFYPQVDKARFYELGYVAKRSGHSRGSTVDLTLLHAQSGKELDMGTPFDFFDSASHHGAKGLTPAQTANRELLKAAMQTAGFIPYANEWWHYTLRNEPHPQTFFSFPVE